MKKTEFCFLYVFAKLLKKFATLVLCPSWGGKRIRTFDCQKNQKMYRHKNRILHFYQCYQDILNFICCVFRDPYLKVPKCENFHRTDFFLFFYHKASMGRRL